MTDYPQLPCPTFAQLLRDAQAGKLRGGELKQHEAICPVCKEWHARPLPDLRGKK